MKTNTINITIKDIKTDEMYYNFKYDAFIDGKSIIENEVYGSDYCNGMTAKEWKKVLKDGEALKIAIVKLSESL